MEDLLMFLVFLSVILQLPVASSVHNEERTNEQSPDGSDTEKDEKIEGEIDMGLRNALAYRSIFAEKRRQQIDTSNRIIAIEDYSKQYKMVEILIDNIFPALNESWSKANKSNYIAGASPFPSTEEMQEVMGVVFEGIPFFGDVLLQLPDITKDIYRRRRQQLEPILLWGMEFCRNMSVIFTGHHSTQLHLMEQELGIVPEDPDYVNPYRKVESDRRSSFPKPVKQKKKSKKGPKLRRRTEL